MVVLFLSFVGILMMSSSSSSVSNAQYMRVKESNGNVSAMFIMGDSSVDCGHNNPFYPFLHRNLSLVPCNGSDSTLLPYLLAQKMGLLSTSLFFGQNGSVEGIKRGLNYGSAHSTIMKSDSQSHQSLNQQLREVFETLQLLQLQLSEETANHFIRSSMFYLSFGKDDYIDHFLGNSSGIMLKYTGKQFARILVNQMVYAIRSLFDANVRKIICMGILPLGCTPRSVSEWRNVTAVHGSRCVREVNNLVLQYNVMLHEHIIELNSEYPDAQIVFCDVYRGIMKIVAKPLHFGFRDAESACCGLGLHNAIVGCLSTELGCSEPSRYVWWDFYNPSERVNSMLADAAWSGHMLSGICHPMPVQDLVYTLL
ncbi:GDSL esterase/lipase At1g71250-like [Mercurialis annua]|uniref:GDSL esterase/lipase At1g71250-like n=1 Tax=Mercurialis annua TaxID=3986 RepID=UPI0021607CA3|nr:GDSL esterase/lipase At1g71250-like [Mercurialis annua]